MRERYRVRERERERSLQRCQYAEWEGKETNGDRSKKITLCGGKGWGMEGGENTDGVKKSRALEKTRGGKKKERERENNPGKSRGLDEKMCV